MIGATENRAHNADDERVSVRVLNCGDGGCLVESRQPVAVGSIATLRITFSGGDFDDLVHVVRCQDITGAGIVYHVRAQFLTAAQPSAESLRFQIRRESGPITASVGDVRRHADAIADPLLRR